MTADIESPAASEFELDGRGPLYRQIKRAVAGAILSGRRAPGDRLPSEHAFMALFGTSRMTVNRALHMLADEGMIVRHRRNGTFVAPKVVEHAVMEIGDIADEIEESGATYAYELLERRDVLMDLNVAEHLETVAGERTLFLKCRHLSDGEAVLIEERYINLQAVPEAGQADFAQISPNRWLLQNVAWSRVEHSILAVNATDDQAGLLHLAPGDACLRVERTTWMAARALTFVQLTYPGQRHRLVGRFSTNQ